MKKRATTTLLCLLMTTSSASAECDLAGAMQIYNSPLPEDEDLRFDSKVTERTEGAVWSIYNDKNKKPVRIIHTDYGESGRDQHILTIGNGQNYVITVHSYFYLAPLNFEGSNTYKEEVSHYLYCDRRLDLPTEWEEYPETYVPAARKAADFFFKSDEIKQQLNAAELKQPIWK